MCLSLSLFNTDPDIYPILLLMNHSILIWTRKHRNLSGNVHVGETDQICSWADCEKGMIGFTQPRFQIKLYEFLLLLSYET